MKLTSAQVPAVRNQPIGGIHGARYATLADGDVEFVEPTGRTGRIVVGVDGSEESVTALRTGVRIANALNASIEAVATWRLPADATVTDEYAYTPADDAKAILSGAAKSVFGANNPDWFMTLTFEGEAADVLIAQSRGAEMLVVGSRGHGSRAGVLLGSVSARCAERALCPVLIIR